MPILPTEFGDLEPFADWSLESEAERYAKRLSSTLDELQAFYDAAFPRLDDAMAYIDQFEFTALPTERHPPALALLFAGQRLVPGRGVAPATRPRQRSGQHGHAHRAGRVTGLRSSSKNVILSSDARMPRQGEMHCVLQREIRS